jgi:hypothetical protein
MDSTAIPKSSRPLEISFILMFFIHGFAMLGTLLFLLPGTPGGGNTDVAVRMSYVAQHPLLWHIGWLGWQLAALADLLFAVALVRTKWIPLLPSILTLALTIIAILPDQYAQFMWTTQGIDLARAGNLTEYAPFESRIFALTAAWGATGYTLAAIGWSVCFATAHLWRKWLTYLSVVAWTLFLYISGAPLIPSIRQPSAIVVSIGNAFGFLLLLIFIVAVAELVLRRSRPDQTHGRMAKWRAPYPGILWRITQGIMRSRFLRAIAELLPTIPMRSNIRNVVYINYLVRAERLLPLLPDGLELQLLGAHSEYGMFTYLTMRHGHFGPTFLGPLRKLLISPLQSNWRIYVRDPLTEKSGVYFVTTTTDSVPLAVGARFLAEGMPMHLLANAELSDSPSAELLLRLKPGIGSAPDAEALLVRSKERPTQGVWSSCFATYGEMLAYTVPQDRAFSIQPWAEQMTNQEIELGIPLDSCEPLVGDVHSKAVQEFIGDAEAFAFHVPKVKFNFLREEHRKLRVRS